MKWCSHVSVDFKRPYLEYKSKKKGGGVLIPGLTVQYINFQQGEHQMTDECTRTIRPNNKIL